MEKNLLIFLVSGGPDSMFAFDLLYNFLNGKKIIEDFDWKKNDFLRQGDYDLVVFHYNHKVRRQSDKEQKFLEQYFNNLNIPVYVGINDDLKSKTENYLRKKRRSWIFDKIKELKFEEKYKEIYLVTGHNLTDRIETTILNMLRGANLQGFFNMDFKEKLNQFENVFILRPLLDIEKSKIQFYCDRLNIPYFVDETNFDENVSKRNKVRKIIFSLSELANKDKKGNNLFFQSWKNIYESFKNCIEEDLKIELKPVYKDFWDKLGVSFVKEIIFEKKSIDIKFLVKLFKKLQIYENIDKGVLNEFLNFFKNSKGGWKLFNGVYFFKTVGKVFVMDKIPNKGFTGEIISKQNGIILRYTKKGDKYKGILLTKYLNKKKIPVFLRGWVKVEEKDGQIIQVII